MEHAVSSSPSSTVSSPLPAASPEEPPASVDVTVDPALSLVTYTLAGFLDPALAQQLAERQAIAMAQLRCLPNTHLTMIDISRCKIQPQDVIEAFRAMLSDPRHKARKLAVVVGGSLAKMQIRRVLHRDTVTYVATVAEARRWLLSGTAPSAAADRVGD